MIVPEHILTDIVAQMPAVVLNSNITQSPQFSWGDKLELNRYLELKKNDSYPLIWLLPSVDSHYNDGEYCSKRLELIIATLESDQNLFNPERYKKSFEIVLNPVADLVLKGLTDSRVTKVIGEKWEIFKQPNYSDNKYQDDNSHGTIELWDALKITFNEVEFNNNCINKNIWQ